jgi:hypothetical protein
MIQDWAFESTIARMAQNENRCNRTAANLGKLGNRPRKCLRCILPPRSGDQKHRDADSARCIRLPPAGSALLQQALALGLPVMTVREGARCDLVAGDDAHSILERLEPLAAVPHDRLEL